MKAYRQERLDNAICFFASEHHLKTRSYPWQTQIYKYLAFFEFELLEETGEAPWTRNSLAMEHGSVPKELYDRRDSYRSDLFRIEDKGENRRVFVALKKPNLDYFSDREIEKMNNLIYIYAAQWVKTSMMSAGARRSGPGKRRGKNARIALSTKQIPLRTS